jgi:hypothetical protein
VGTLVGVREPSGTNAVRAFVISTNAEKSLKM